MVRLGEENKRVPVPDVKGKDEATAKKTLTDNGFQVTVETTENADGVADGCVASQSISAGTEADPGTTVTIYVYHAPAATPVPTTNPDDSGTGGGETTTSEWRCNVQLVQPENYSGGLVQLLLVQNVNGQNVETVILEGQTITFPYIVSVKGADGVETGTIYLQEMVAGEYVERGHYSNVPFKQVEAGN